MMNGKHVAASLSVTAVAPVAARLDDAVSAFLRVRPRLFGIAYRMLGDLAEAEDIVQDAWIRWQTTDRSRVQNPPAFLAATTTRLAINELQSARVRREEYGVERLIEAIDASADPETGVERAEALRSAAVLLLEKLSPTERAAYVLREAFDYPYRRIADILRIKEANVRQLVTRARSHVAGRPRAFASSSEERRFLDVLLAACTTGDLTSLERLLVSKIVAKSERAGHSLSVGRRLSKWARSCRCSRGRRSSRGSARVRPRQENSL
jgi:RNA polymerase sigma factor (sigma-70 family)